jgi:hypothetical protein
MSNAFGVEIAKVDLETLTDFQKELHITNNPTEEIMTVFIKTQEKTTWHSRVPMKLSSNETNGVITYTANNTFDRIEYVDLICDIPALQVKKEFKDTIRICWTHNLLHNIVNTASLYKDEILITTIDTYWLDNYSQRYIKPGFREMYNVGIGNVTFLEEWSDYLPAYTLTGPQPWPIGEDMSLSFPLFLLPSTSHLTFRYRPNLDISRLLRMQKFDPKLNIWRDIKCNFRYIDGAGTMKQIKFPELRGYYDYKSNDERDWWKCGDKQHVFYINHIINADSKNAREYGELETVDLSCGGVCKAIHWVAENQYNMLYNNRSNYTSNENVYKGWCPWETYNITYGSSSMRTETTISEISERLDSFHHGRIPPNEAGYGFYSFSHDPMSINYEIGIVLSKVNAKLNVKLKNTDPFLRPLVDSKLDEVNDDLDDDFDLDPERGLGDDVSEISTHTITKTELEKRAKFILRVRLLVSRKVVFNYNIDTKSYDMVIVDAK